jgi:hypothetical protein
MHDYMTNEKLDAFIADLGRNDRLRPGFHTMTGLDNWRLKDMRRGTATRPEENIWAKLRPIKLSAT